MTLQDNLKALYELQLVDSGILRIKRIHAAMDTGEPAKARAEAAAATHKSADADLHRVSGDLKSSELELAGLETKLKTYQGKLYQGSNAKELAHIEKEIEALGRQRALLDERILSLMDQVETTRSAANTAKAEADAANKLADDTVAAYRNRTAELQQELNALIKRRPELAATVEDQDLLKRYEDIRAKCQGIGIGKLEGANCGGCHMTLPSSVVKLVKEAREVQSCENCRRLLLA